MAFLDTHTQLYMYIILFLFKQNRWRRPQCFSDRIGTPLARLHHPGAQRLGVGGGDVFVLLQHGEEALLEEFMRDITQTLEETGDAP